MASNCGDKLNDAQALGKKVVQRTTHDYLVGTALHVITEFFVRCASNYRVKFVLARGWVAKRGGQATLFYFSHFSIALCPILGRVVVGSKGKGRTD